MSAILKDDILSRKSREISGKEKVNKIMNTIVEPLVKSDLTKQEHKEVKSTIETTKTAEDTVKQNIFSSEILIEGECATDLDEIRNRLKKELKPTGEIESIIVDRIISSIWRLKRCLKIESQILEYESSCIQEYEQGFFRVRKRTDKEMRQLKALKIIDVKNHLEELSKYETALEGQIYKALSELENIKQGRTKQVKSITKRTK
ncbi:MAG: hypothetical protein AABZ43_06745 [Planctomycetota bacterium]